MQDLGGWKSASTLLKADLRVDERAQREVLEGPTERAVTSTAGAGATIAVTNIAGAIRR